MDHLGKHALVTLSPEQESLVADLAADIYRPCCNNSTMLPDCNHGMAMLGLLELGAAAGLGREELLDLALAANSYWFADQYLTLARYFDQQGVRWGDISPAVLLSK